MEAGASASPEPGGTEIHLDGFLRSPRETLAIELKQWLDLNDREVKGKLARHLMAIANHGGGWIQVGFIDPKDGTYPHENAQCPDPTAYSTDAINSIVERYARPVFHCEVMWRQCEEGCPGPHAFIRVEGGQKVPVVCAKNGPDPSGDPREGVVYTRLPGPKSAPVVQPEDWHALLERCMRYRRDDLVETIRSTVQLLGADGLRAVFEGTEAAGDGGEADSDESGFSTGEKEGAAERSDTPRSRDEPVFPREIARSRDVDLEDWVTGSEARFGELRKTLPSSDPDLYSAGYWWFAYRLDPPPAPPVPLPELRRDLLESVGSETGWPAWWWPSSDPERSPHPVDDTIECWMRGGAFDDAAHADYWRASSHLELFLLRGYDEDAMAQLSPHQHGGIQPGTILDPTLPVWRVGECLLHADRLARRRDAKRVAVEIRWTGLKGRSVGSLDPLRYHWASGTAQTDEAVSWLTVEADLIAGSLPQLVYELTLNLFVQFDFFEMPIETIERELDRLRGGRLD